MAPPSTTAAVSAYNATLRTVTQIKLRELSRQKSAFDVYSRMLLASLNEQPTQRAKLVTLLKALEKKGQTPAVELPMGLKNTLFLTQEGRWDLCASEELYGEKFDEALKAIRQVGTKLEYSYLFGSVLDEWLQTEGANEEDEPEEKATTEERPEMLAQKATLEGLVFEPSTADPQQWKMFLEEIFADDHEQEAQLAEGVEKGGTESDSWGVETETTKEEDQARRKREDIRSALRQMRSLIEKYGQYLLEDHVVAAHEVQAAINVCISRDLLSKSRRSTAQEISKNDVIMNEIASVLTLTLRDLKNWQWPEDGIGLMMRRHLNGKYRCFLNEDLITSIFLQLVGLLWGAKIKEELRSLLAMWYPAREGLTKNQLTRRKLMLGSYYDCVEYESNSRPSFKGTEESRFQEFKRWYFLPQLPESIQAVPDYDEADYHQEEKTPSMSKLKEQILHRILVDIKYTHAAHPDASSTVCTADASNFGPSLSHSIVLESLRFIGMPQEWLDFFGRFLTPKVRFRPDDPLRTTVRGLPTAHTISTMMGEVLLFHMDFSVNQRTQGIIWYRIHDDFWWWDRSPERCTVAWETMKEIAELTGVVWNESKCGSRKIWSAKELRLPRDSRPAEAVEGLPTKDVKWGLLLLDSIGTFTIDRALVDKHIAETRRQLSRMASVLGFIKAYTRYITWILRNCAQSSVVFGKAHTMALLETLQHIHRQLFPEHDGNIFAVVKAMLYQRFPNLSTMEPPILDGWLAWPMSHGGLGLPNVLLETSALLHGFLRSETIAVDIGSSDVANFNSFAHCLALDARVYADAKKKWDEQEQERGDSSSSNDNIFNKYKHEHLFSSSDFDPGCKKPRFMSRDEFHAARDTAQNYWAAVRTHLMSAQPEARPEFRPQFSRWLRQLRNVSEPRPDSPFALSPPPSSLRGGRGGGRGRRGRGGRAVFDDSWGWDTPPPPTVPKAAVVSTEMADVDSKWCWLLTFYGDQLERAFGELEFVDPRVIPVGMVRWFKERQVRWDQ